MKKCNKCGATDSGFGKNKYSKDGLQTSCKLCVKDQATKRRRRLDVMLSGIDKRFEKKFRELHKQWDDDGFPPHSKPVVVSNRCMTHMESKSELRTRVRSKVVLLDQLGDVVQTFKSISHASRESGDSRLYIRWSSDNNSRTKGRNQWMIK